MNFKKHFRLIPGDRLRLAKWDPTDTLDFKDKEEAQGLLERDIKRLDELQYLLAADSRQALLVILQGMDTAGKDGTIRHVMSACSPQGCQASSFKVPSLEESNHDFLWRVHQRVPPNGWIGIFNRSHYEDVLVPKVHGLVSDKQIKERYKQINHFEKMLSQNGVTIIKFFLNISKSEQKKRLEERIRDPRKRWKISPQDVLERKFWHSYRKAYEYALEKCNTEEAPWYIIPSDHKWFRNIAVAKIIVQTLEQMKLRIRPPEVDISKIRL